MTTDLSDFRLVTASAYPGMMAPLTGHPSCVCVLAGNHDRDFADGPTRLLSLEALDGVRRRWRFGDVSRLADFVPKALAELPPDTRPILLVPPRSNAGWQAAAAAWPGRASVAASPQVVVEPIATNKIYVRAELRRRGVPVPDALVLDRWGADYRRVRSRLGTPFVVQTPNGAGGQGTFLVHDEAGLEAALASAPHVPRWLVSRFVGDTTINIAGIVHRDGVRLLPASVQTSGIAELGAGFGAYCGSDFGAGDIRGELLREAYRHAGTVGEWLREMGHLGLFGADIALNRNDFAFLEVNPRIQGSSWLMSKLQSRIGAAPCLVRHVHALLGDPAGDDGIQVDPAEVRLSGSHLLIRWRGPASVVRRLPSAEELTAEAEGRVEVTSLPDVGVTLHPGAILARLESDTHLAEPGGRSLRAATARLVDGLYSSVEVFPA